MKTNIHFLHACKLTTRHTELIQDLAFGTSLRDAALRYESSYNYVRNTRRMALTRMHSFALQHPHWLPWFHEYRRRVMKNRRGGYS